MENTNPVYTAPPQAPQPPQPPQPPQQNYSYQPPEPPKTKKKLDINFKEFFTLPYIMMAVCILANNFIVPWVFSVIQTVINMIGIEMFDYYYFNTILNSFTGIIQTFVLILVYAACAFFASKKVADMFKFVGVSFIAISISGFIPKAINAFVALVSLIFDLGFSANNVISGILSFVSGIAGTVVALVLGLALFMFANKFTKELKIKKAGKKKDA